METATCLYGGTGLLAWRGAGRWGTICAAK